MIPLRFVKEPLTDYNSFLKGIETFMESVLAKGYIKKKSQCHVNGLRTYYKNLTPDEKKRFEKSVEEKKWKSKRNSDTVLASMNILGDETVKLLKELQKDDYKAFHELANTAPHDLSSIISKYESEYPDIVYDKTKTEQSKLYEQVKYIFVEHAYEDSLDKGSFIGFTNATVCPYCNRSFIHTVNSKKKKEDGTEVEVTIKGELDHFYSKKMYPYLAISRYNLVPSCPACNHIKSDDDSSKLVNPYALASSDECRFNMKITGEGFADLTTCAKAISIDLTTTTLVGNKEKFHLEKIYNTHTDYAAEIYFKHRLLQDAKPYKDWVEGKVGKLSNTDKMRLVLGIYGPEDFCMRPLSKFRYDLAKKYKLIEDKI